MASTNTPADLTVDSREAPYGVGYDLEREVSKHQWMALAVDLLRAEHGEAASLQVIREAIAERLDVLHAAGIVPRTLPRRYSRPA